MKTSISGYTVAVTVDATDLAPGTYQGSITLTSGGLTSAPVPITFRVWTGDPPPVTVNPPSVAFIGAGDDCSQSQTIDISTGALPLNVSVSVSAQNGASWLRASLIQDSNTTNTLTPAKVTASICALYPNLVPGVYHETIIITSPAGSTNSVGVPVTFTVTPPVPKKGIIPLASTVLNGASQTAGAVAPGEIVTIFGQNIGPAVPAGVSIGADGKVASKSSDVVVFFDDAPAPLLYAFATQLNVVVPYEVAGRDVTNIAIYTGGAVTNAGGIPVASAAPAIFTVDGSGLGAPAVLNQDNSWNSASNPAARGSVIQIYATGIGLTAPAGVTGEVTGRDPKKAVLPVTLTMGGVDATILYAGSAPNAVSGLAQINAVVPPSVVPGPAVSILLKVGTVAGQNGVAIAVK